MVLFQRKGTSSVDLNINYGGDELESGGQWSKQEIPPVYSGGASKRRSLSPSMKKKKGTTKIAITQFLVIAFLSVMCMKSHREVSARRSQLNVLYSDYQNTQSTLTSLENELDKAHEDFHKLQMSLLAEQASMPKLHPSEFTDDHRDEVASGIIQKHEKQSERITQLQTKIQEYHRAELQRRFGQGPYYVEFQIDLDGSRKWFTLEMAPSNVMPHSVYFFMDMVDQKVWDNTVFLHTQDHILTSVLATPGGEDKRPLVESRLAFPEYSDQFQHEKFTFGFANVGPEFYLNMHDNVENHGPGGASLHNDSEHEADPCFARVVIGTSVIEQLKKKTYNSEDRGNVYSSIQSVRVIKPPAERLKQIENGKTIQ